MKHFLPLLILTGLLFGQSESYNNLESLLNNKSHLDSLLSEENIDSLISVLEVATNQLSKEWHVFEGVDEMTDEKSLGFIRYSNEEQFFNYSNKTGFLNIRSAENSKIMLYVNWGGFVTSNEAKVTYRLDSADAKTETWYMSSTGKASLAGYSAILIKDIIDSKKALFRVTPYGDNPVTYSFDISGLDSLIKQYPEFMVQLDNQYDAEIKRKEYHENFMNNYTSDTLSVDFPKAWQPTQKERHMLMFIMTFGLWFIFFQM